MLPSSDGDPTDGGGRGGTQDPSDDIDLTYELLNNHIANICTKCVICADNYFENILVFCLSRERATNER